MKTKVGYLLMAIAILASAISVSAKGGHGSKAHWGYKGKLGPKSWGKLSSEYALCASGMEQSPVNISRTVSASLGSIEFDYKRVAAKCNQQRSYHENGLRTGFVYTSPGQNL